MHVTAVYSSAENPIDDQIAWTNLPFSTLMLLVSLPACRIPRECLSSQLQMGCQDEAQYFPLFCFCPCCYLVSGMAICLKVTKEHKHWSRRNGWSLPLHWLQISAWIFLVMFAFLYFGVLVPNMPEGAWQISAYIINGFVFIFHIVIHLISVSLNPADINVRAKASKGPLPSFDRSKHNHVIENEYCHICEVKVGRKSKHCSVCNKCVSEFDHHCKWLNNCVGGRNYRLFISCVSSALLGSLIIFVSAVVLIVAYFEEASWLFHHNYDITTTPFLSKTNSTTERSELSPTIEPSTELSPLPNITLTGTQTLIFMQVQGTVWICFVFLTAILSLVAVSLLGHLLGFHIFLMCQNYTTYDYIVHKRDSSVPPANRSEKKKPKPNFDCHFKLLQHLKTKKGNQISPKSEENGKGDEIEEWEMQANTQHSRPPEGKKPTMPIVTENKCAAVNDEEDCPLENYVGNVYIGSPHRRRHYLEPLNVRQKVTSPKNKAGKKEENPVKKDVQNEIDDKDEDGLADNDIQDANSASQSQVYSHGVPRRHHRSPSPAPLLSPILESEISSGSAIVSWKHRSVSEQSLHTLDESEEEITAVPSTCTVQIEPSVSKGLGNREDSGSLSNLFLSKDQLEELEEDNNNTLIDDDDRVHEVCIIPQGSLESCESNHNVSDAVEVTENCGKSDPLINGEVWAYSSRNGCQIRDGFVSFRRSCSMQDNERLKNMPSDPLTRCCSEDELKSAQRMSKLQRRLSEDRDLWMLRGCNNIPQTWKEHSPKAGISATAVFCVDEPEESFRIPGIPFGLKRKYNHFSVPNHIVLPCSNSVHPESRKRTRPVGSKPPKAFHA